MDRKDDFIRIYTAQIKRAGSTELLEWLEETDFFYAPASTRFHGNYEGGLCEHSVNVYEEMMRLAHAYPEVAKRIKLESAAIVTLLHDLCKIGCYKPCVRRKQINGVWHNTAGWEFQEDFPYGGHGSKSVYLVHRFMRLTEEEAAAINCHMGFADRPADDFKLGKVYEVNPLAWLAHVADESATYIRETTVEI